MNPKGFGIPKITTRRLFRSISLLVCLAIVLTLGAPLNETRAAVQQDVPVNYPPDGDHWWAEGEQTSPYCAALGWAFDPDDTARDLSVRILADGSVVATATADIYNDYLEEQGVCEGGTCIFYVILWGLITPIEWHEITVQAWDLETEGWYSLPDTPKALSCINYDIYTMNIKTGQVERITTMEGTGEYDPSWSPDGKYIVHDVVYPPFPFGQDLYITNVKTKESVPLPGGEGGNDAAWSPNGQWIVFDAWPEMEGELPNLYLVSPEGGTPEMVQTDAVHADWAPNSRYLVYQKETEGSLWTTSIQGGVENLIAPWGFTPAWSPDGQWIAYELDCDLWKMRVNLNGVPR